MAYTREMKRTPTTNVPPAHVEVWGPTKQFVKGNAAEHIFEDLREQILSSRIERGAKLPTERELAAAYHVSGATVREAMRGLATARLVDVRHGSGAYVTAHADQLIASALHSMIQVEKISVPEVISVYGAIIGFTAELATTHATREQLEAMQHALDQLEEGGSVKALHVQLARFLDMLAASSGNLLLATLCRFLAGVQLGLVNELSGGSYEVWRRATSRLAKDRQALLDAIKKRDKVQVRVTARRYHQRALKVISALRDESSLHPEEMHFSQILAKSLQAVSGTHSS